MTNLENNNLNIDPKLFALATDEEKSQAVITRPTVSYWQDAWRRLRKNKVALASLIIVTVLILMAIIIPEVSPYGYEEILEGKSQLAPNAEHLFGTDMLGRDMLVRCAIGLRISLLIGFISAILVVSIGVVYGSIAGFYGGKVDLIMMRVVDVIYSVPSLLLAILLQVVLKAPLDRFFDTHQNLIGLKAAGSGLISIIVVLAMLFWVDMARIVRGQILSLKQQEFVLAAKTIGSNDKIVIFKHLIPNCMGAIVVTATLKIPEAIFYEAFLSFIGLGVSSPMASLGSLVSNGVKAIYSYPYVIIEPAILISLLILSLNLFGDGLRDALDPRLKQ